MLKLKYLLDQIGALILLCLISPVFLVLCILIRLRLGGPVFFTQDRPGLNGKIFKMIKFRTMTNAVDASGQLLPDAVRLTPFGKMLRQTSLDELPELLNMVRGEMSFIGPRPLLVEYLPLYTKEQARRHQMKPGLTGWAQVNGRNAISFTQRFELDVWYIDHWSFGLDLKIIWMTLGKVIKKSDINQAGQATMEKFNGKN